LFEQDALIEKVVDLDRHDSEGPWRIAPPSIDDRNWREEFRRLDAQSEQVRTAAMIIFEQILV
jgi:hypothetical protein